MGTKMRGQQTRNRGWAHGPTRTMDDRWSWRLRRTPRRSAYDKGAIALPSNCNAASSETPLPSVLFLTTPSRHFVIFVYQSPPNSPASTAPLLPPPPPLPPLLPSPWFPVSVRRRFLVWSGLRHVRLWSVISVGVFHVLSSKARPWRCLSSFEQKT